MSSRITRKLIWEDQFGGYALGIAAQDTPARGSATQTNKSPAARAAGGVLNA